jgi:uncharacterized membrane protein YdjX (TVP38/TMEM64 family)
MRRYLAGTAAVAGALLLIFLGAEALPVSVLTDPRPALAGAGAGAAALGVALLVVDAVLPVPSSVVMTVHGALFGVATGALLSMLGAVGAAGLGFGIGRQGHRLVRGHESDAPAGGRAARLVEQWGALAIVVTRPIPLLAETVMIVAGAAPIGWRRAMLAAAAGSLPGALLYAVAGASVGTGYGPLGFGLVLLVAGALWLAGRRLSR